MLNYVWECLIVPTLGYAFSRNHTCPYSAIGLQELNLLYKYGQIYWNTACLTVNAAASEDNENNKNTNYGKIAKAIGEMQNNGVNVSLPDINKAGFEFLPDTQNGEIIFGLKGIVNVGDEVAYKIVNNRLYNDLIDFIEKTETSKLTTINLIKGGAFDKIDENRVRLMQEYLHYLALKENPPKKELNKRNLDKINELNILQEEDKIYVRYYNFNKYVLNKEFFIEKRGNKSYYVAKDMAYTFFTEHYVPHLKEEIDYWFIEDGILFCKSSYDKIYKKRIGEFDKIIKSPEMVKLFNQKTYESYVETNWNKYCKGTPSKWEMDSLSYYYHEHELKNVDRMKYNISNFNDLPSQPEIEGVFKRKERTFSKYKLNKIVGTVLDRDKVRHIVTLLTPDGVVTVKFYSGAFIWYDKQISERDEDDKKTVIETSWFKRGNLLMITGIRRDDKFYPKKYADSIYQHTVCSIEQVNEDGTLILRTERASVS
jgi:DNA polymerase-3 subunit alpha